LCVNQHIIRSTLQLGPAVLMTTPLSNKRDGDFQDQDEFHKYTRVISIVLASNKDMRGRLTLLETDLSKCNANLCTTRVDAAYYKQLAGELLVERDALTVKCNQRMDATNEVVSGVITVDGGQDTVQNEHGGDAAIDTSIAFVEDIVNNESRGSNVLPTLMQDTVNNESRGLHASTAFVPDTMDPEISDEILAHDSVNRFGSHPRRANHSHVKLSKTFRLLDDAIACISADVDHENEMECKYSEKVASLERANLHIKLLTDNNALIVREKAEILDLYNAIKDSFGTPSNNYCTSLFRSSDGSANDVIRRMLVDKVSQIEKLKEVIF
jgi:hypothetical protein